jgi:hypothetical protein
MKIIIQLASILLPLFVSAQIPNPDFELWHTVQKDIPQQWGIYGSTKKATGYQSPFAVRIERDIDNPNSPGAVIYGNPDQNFSGGIAFVGRPDSAVFFVKRHLVSGDSAWFLVFLSRGGIKISQDNFKFGGSDTSKFIRMAFKIHYNDTGKSDSLLIGVSSTNPEEQYQGSFVIVDNIGFSGGQFGTIPNAQFEDWTNITIENPSGWFSSNVNNMVSSTDKQVIKTTDAALHQYAVKIMNTKNGNEYRQGYIMAGKQGSGGPLPGFAVNGRDSVLYIYYKCFPKNGDEINIGVMMYDSGQMVGTGFIRQGFDISTWSQTPIPIQYFGGYNGTPDSAAIFCAAFSGGDPAYGASVLYVDGLRFNKAWVSVNTPAIYDGLLNVYPNPAQGDVHVRFSAQQSHSYTISIYNTVGKLVHQEKGIAQRDGQQNVLIKTTAFDSGIYTIQLQTGLVLTKRKLEVLH